MSAQPAATSPVGRRLVNRNEAAKALGISMPTLRRRIDDGTIKTYKLGPRLLRIDLDEVAASLPVRPAERELADPNRARLIAQIVDSAPPLTAEQRDRLALLLRQGGESA